MKKRFLIVALLTILFITMFSCASLATNDSMLNNAVEGTRNVLDDTKNAVERGAEGVGNVVRDGSEDIKNAAGMAGEAVSNTYHDVANTANNAAGGNQAQGTFLGLNSNVWAWIIVIIVAIIIIVLICRYMKDSK